MLLTPEEFVKTKLEKGTPVLIYLSQNHFEGLVEGLKPMPSQDPPGCGIQIIPLPGQPGYVAIPICMPDEVPYVHRNGSIQCIPTDFGDDIGEGRTEVPGTGCVFSFSHVGNKWRATCTGTCTGRRKCIGPGIFSLDGGRFFLGCRCPRRRMEMEI